MRGANFYPKAGRYDRDCMLLLRRGTVAVQEGLPRLIRELRYPRDLYNQVVGISMNDKLAGSNVSL